MKKNLYKSLIIICLFSLLSYSAISQTKTPRVYIYGETHCNKIIMDAELIAWQNFYNNHGMRHLFIEYDYSTGQLLNEWMKDDDDSLLMQIYENWKGSIAYNLDNLDFYKNIKRTCPETIFHGTDVGPRPGTTDSLLLQQLEEKGLTDSMEYKLVLENIEQAKHYKKYHDDSIRENYLASNFIRDFDSLPENEIIMGIYGSAHTVYLVDSTGKVPSMIAQIRNNYNDINIEDYDISNFSLYTNIMPPLGTEYFIIKGKTYKATYFGEKKISGWEGYKSWKFWRIENPDETLKKLKHKKNYNYYSNYPTIVNQGDIFRIELTKSDNSKQIEYYRADGKVYDGQPSTNLILHEK